jgi:hypothetical protein
MVPFVQPGQNRATNAPLFRLSDRGQLLGKEELNNLKKVGTSSAYAPVECIPVSCATAQAFKLNQTTEPNEQNEV